MQYLPAYDPGVRYSQHQLRCNQCGETLVTDDEDVIHRCLTCGNTRFYLLDLRTPFYMK